MINLVVAVVLALIGALLSYMGYKAKFEMPYKPNFILLGIGIILILGGIVMFVNPFAQGDENINPGDIKPGDYEEGKVFFQADVISAIEECENLYCFRVNVNSVARGTLDTRNNLLIKTDLLILFNEDLVEIKGIKKEDYEFASASDIIQVYPMDLEAME